MTNRAISQCATTSFQAIPDDGILTINLSVSGLLDSDLASPTQGICAVEIDFMHEYLGDLTVSLVSPSGTSIELIAPVTIATGGTNLSRWNIQFLPCMTPVSPDPGFAVVWSNDQAWGSFASYSGSYHPNMGCLEDFNTGPANGIWKFIIEDDAVPQTGSVARVAIIFCNPNGLQCGCDPNAGTLSPSSLLFCESDVIQTSNILVDYGGVPPNPAIYGYSFILNNGNTIIAGGNTFSPQAPGVYTICGLSYLNAYATEVNNYITGGDFNALTQAIGNGSLCAAISSNCTSVNIVPIPDTTIIDVLICRNDSYVFKGQLYSTAGTFYVGVDGVGQCDSIYRLNIMIDDLTAEIVIPDSISCGSSGVALNGSISHGGVGPISYEWSTEFGIINGNLNNSQVIALVPGIYTLTVRDGVCEDSKEVIVHGDLSYPRIFVEGGSLTCIQTTITIHPVVIPSNVTYSWTGPGGFISALKDIDVSTPGRYFLRVISSNGCEAFTYIDIISNTTPPDATITLTDKSCLGSFGVIGVAGAGYIYEWQTPGTPAPPNQIIAAYDAGIYTITVTDPNTGCSATGSLSYVADYVIPPFILNGIDSIRCNAGVNLTLVDVNLIIPPIWTGPNGLVFNNYNVSLTQPGFYSIHLIGENGCKNDTTIQIFASANYPSYGIINDTISCYNSTATIGINYPDADIFNWPGLLPPESNNAFVQVNFPGTYTIMALDTNSGCMIEATALVTPNLALPQFSFQGASLTCSQSTGTLSFIPIAGNIYDLVQWQLPDMTIINNSSIVVNEVGQYLLSVTGNNGCIGSALVTVEKDTTVPVFFLEPDTLGCDFQGIIHNIRVDSLAGILWTGPNGFTSSELDPIVTDTGVYVATAFSLNGCPSQVTTHVAADLSPPLSILSNEELTCLTPFADLSVSSPDVIIAYEWKDATGNILGNNSVVSVSSPGMYIVQIEGDNHCLTNDTIMLAPGVFPVVIVLTDTLKCSQDTAVVSATTDVTNPLFIWMDINGDTLIINDQVSVDYPGPFIISVTGTNGCETRDTVTLPTDISFPIPSINLIGEVRCQNRDFTLDGTASTPSSIEFHWTTPDGMILSNDTLSIIDARDTGIYFLTIENPENGCMQTDSIIITEHPDAIKFANIEVKRPVCSGESNAEITITGLEGGVAPFLYQINTSPAQSSNIFQGLIAGSYTLEILDAEGCLYDTTVIIDPTNLYTVDAGPDQEIFIGSPAFLLGESTIIPDEIFSLQWDSLGNVLCQDCFEVAVKPYATATYRFQVTSETGCIVEDEVTVYVIEKGQLFIANVFSPNQDEINDHIEFHSSPGVVKVLRWTIFDRWGNAVFHRGDFDPYDPTVYWDGTAKGSEMLNPGVFAYIIEVELLTGKEEIHHGTITLLR